MTLAKDITGERFWRLVVLRRAQNDHKNKVMWVCRCDCGNEVTVRGTALRTRNTKSCGCLVKETMAQTGRGNATHNLSGTPEYRSWARMNHRCYSPNDNKSQYYRDRGVKVCDRWRKSFENFLSDMGKKPTLKHTIDRIDTDGNYEPKNCRWATYSQQNSNRRPFHRSSEK